VRLQNWLYTLPLKIRALFGAPKADRELDEELQYHVRRLTQENLARGMSQTEAREAALRAMDGLEQNKEKCRETRNVSSVSNFGRDMRYALRLLRKSPGFTLVAVLTLALGIGANSAIFSVVDAILLRPLPFPEPERLVKLWENQPTKGYYGNVVNPYNYLDWRENTHSFVDMAAYSDVEVNVTGAGEAVSLPTSRVTTPFFSVLGIPAMLGRTFLSEDGVPGNHNTVISYGLWQERFGGNRDVIGKTLTINGQPAMIIGVMPPGFRVPKSRAQLWSVLPITRAETWKAGRYLAVIARLKPGITLQQAQQDMKSVAQITARLRPENDTNWSAEADPMLQDVTQDVRRPLWVLLSAVGFLLLIACANVANLLLMRGTGRLREIAVREALGASRRRIVQQLLAEGFVLAVIGLGLGLLFAKFGLMGLLSMIPQSTPLPRTEPVTIDLRVLLFAILVSLITVALFALMPALRLSRVDVQEAMRQGTLRSAGSGNRLLRRGLVAAEIALAIILSIGAGLMFRSFERLTSVDPGFRPEHVLTMRIFLSPARFETPQKRSQHVNDLVTALRELPGVEAAASVHFLPLRGQTSGSCFEPGDAKPTSQSPDAQFLITTPGYFRTMGTPLVSGRDFDERDIVGAPSAMIVNQAFADRYLKGQDPLGKPFSVCWSDSVVNPAHVVGVVGNARQEALQDAPEPTIFLPQSQAGMYFATLVVRAQGDASLLTHAAEAAVHRVDPDQALAGMQTMDSVLSDSVSQPRFRMMLLIVFAVLALVLASIGVYGVISYSVGQRNTEIGIRMALGARRPQVLLMVMREALLLALIALIAGLGASLALMRLLRSLLFEVAPADLPTFASVSVLMLLVALLATWAPARRATRVDPMVALRYE